MTLRASIFICGFAVLGAQSPCQTAGSAKTEPLPLVIASTEATTPFERELAEYPIEKNLDRAKAKGYKIVTLNGCRVVYPENVFGLQDAVRQTKLMQACLDAFSAGQRTLDISAMDPENQKVVRGMFANSEQVSRIDRAVTNPNLKLLMGVRTDVEYKRDDKPMTLVMVPQRPSLDKLASYVTPEPDQAKVKVELKDKPKKALPQLSFLFPPQGSDAFKQLEWSGEIREHFVQVCESARNAYESLSKLMLQQVMSAQSDRYGAFGDKGLDFNRLSENDQNYFATQLAYKYQGIFGDKREAASFMMNNRPSNVRSEFVLSANFVEDSGPGWATIAPIYIPFRCPLGGA
jgi:hypothetical protein